jgi:hypothetical protein
MPKCEFEKDLTQIVEDFNDSTQSAIAALSNKPPPLKPDGKAPPPPPPLPDKDIFDASLDRLYHRTKLDAKRFDQENKNLENARKEHAKEVQKRNASATDPNKAHAAAHGSAEEENAQLLEPFKKTSERLEKALEGLILKVRSQLMGRKDLGDKFAHAANELFLDLKKLDAELDKFVATELKRKPREEKPLEVIPSKFLADFKVLWKKEGPEKGDKVDPKVTKALSDAEEKLKRIDTNNAFNKVTSLCETAQATLQGLLKAFGTPDPKLAKEIKDLIKDIENYDNHMFLLSKH